MRTKTLTMQRQAARAMKDAMHIGIDPRDANATFGVCFAKPSAVSRIKAWERKERQPRIYTRSHAIDVWESESE